MIQLASAFSAVINGGNYYQPHVVKQIISNNLSKQESKQLTTLLEKVYADLF